MPTGVTEQINGALTGFRFFSADNTFLEECNFPEVTDVATRIIATSRRMMATARDQSIKRQWQTIIQQVSGIVRSLSFIAEQAEVDVEAPQEPPISGKLSPLN